MNYFFKLPMMLRIAYTMGFVGLSMCVIGTHSVLMFLMLLLFSSSLVALMYSAYLNEVIEGFRPTTEPISEDQLLLELRVFTKHAISRVWNDASWWLYASLFLVYGYFTNVSMVQFVMNIVIALMIMPMASVNIYRWGSFIYMNQKAIKVFKTIQAMDAKIQE